MSPPAGCAPTSLMRMHGVREGRGWMTPDPALPWPSLREQAETLGIVVLALLVVLIVAHAGR